MQFIQPYRLVFVESFFLFDGNVVSFACTILYNKKNSIHNFGESVLVLDIFGDGASADFGDSELFDFVGK